MKRIIGMAAFFIGCTVASIAILWWGFTCPEYWENPEWLLNLMRVVGIIGTMAFPALGASVVQLEVLEYEEEKEDE